MAQYLLSTHSVESGAPAGPPPSPEEMRMYMQPIIDLEVEMDAGGTFVFGGGLHGPDAATVVTSRDGDVAMTDGPFVETKEHIAGFYVINAADLDEALEWAGKVSAATGGPIEVRPFRATGRVADHVADMADG
jgi:hypothetical protein